MNTEWEQMSKWCGGRREPFCWGVLIRKDSTDEVRLENKCMTADGVGGEGISRRRNGRAKSKVMSRQ